MHRETKQEYEYFLKNLEVPTKDIRSEYLLAHVLMAGTAQQITEILDKMESTDFYDRCSEIIFNTVKEEANNGNMKEGQEQFIYITTKHNDRFTSKTFYFNPDNKEYDNITNFALLDVPDETQMRSCIELVKRKRALRDSLYNLYTAVDMCCHEDNGVEKAMQYIAKYAEAVGDNDTDDAIIPSIDFAGDMIELAYECNDLEKQKQRTINMPWPKYQEKVGSLQAGDLVIVSARSGDGKSAFALNVGIEAGVTQNISTLYINSEMSKGLLEARYLSYMCKIDSHKYLSGDYRDEESDDKYYKPVIEAIKAAADKYYKGSLLFATIPDLQLSNIEKIVRQDCSKRNTRLVIVDYIGRMDITKAVGVKDLQEWQIMRLAANRLKTLAQKYNVCIIMIAQLTDEGTLQGSKAMKNECDLWLSINRLKNPDDKYANKTLRDIFPYNTFVTVEKARGVKDASAIAFRYEGATMTFSDTKQAVKDMIDRNLKYDKYANKLMAGSEYTQLENMLAFDVQDRA